MQYLGNSGLVFNELNISKADVISTGEYALVALYKGRPADTLNHLRLQTFHHKVIVSFPHPTFLIIYCSQDHLKYFFTIGVNANLEKSPEILHTCRLAHLEQDLM